MRKWILSISLVILVALPVWLPVGAQTEEKRDPFSRPSVLFTNADLDLLRVRAETTHDAIWADIKAFVDSRVGTAPPETAPYASETEYRNWGNQLIAYAFACALTEDPVYCDLAKTHLLTYVKWDEWDEDNKRDLGLAHMLMGSSLAYDWIYNYLTPEEQRRAYDGLLRWGQRMYEASTQPYVYEVANWWTGSFVQNHHWINHSALGVAGLVLSGHPPGDESVSAGLVNCFVSSTNNVNLRSGPSTDDSVEAVLPGGQSVPVVSQDTGPAGYIWWQTSENLWVRSDVVIETGDCEMLTPADVDVEAWVARATEQFERIQFVLNGIRDGSWHEGIQYQNYGMVMSMPFLDALREMRGIDLFPHMYMDNFTDWRVYNYLPGTTQYIMAHGNFEWDWGNGYNAQSLLRWTAHEYDDPYAQWAADELVAAAGGRGEKAWDVPFAVFEFLYFDPTVEPKAPTDLPGARVFPDLEGVIWRTGWEEDDTVFGLKTGAYGGTFGFDTFTQGRYPWMPPCAANQCEFSIFHDHADANTFYLYRYGDWLAPENVGFGVWDTQFHNTILIDRRGQFRPETAFYSSENYFVDTEGYLEATANTANFDYVASDATLPYAANISDVRDVTRYVLWVRPSYFIMVDNLQADQPHQYSWVSHFMDSASVEGNWIRGMTGGSQQLAIQVLAPQDFEAVTGDDGYAYVRVQTTGVSQNAQFVHLLYPTIDSLWDTRPTAGIVEDNGRQMAIRVTRNDDSGLTDDILLAYDGVDGAYTLNGYTFDGRIAVITRDAAGQIKAIFTAGGTALTEQGAVTTPLLENLDPERPFEVMVNADGTLAVSSSVAGGVRLYAPNVASLTVNDVPWTYTHEGTYIIIGGPAS